MRTVGQILKDSREAKHYKLEDIEKHTKIRIELLEALESDNYSKLPPSTFIQGFIKNYGKFLGLDIEKLLAVFRRDYESKKHPPIILESFKNPISTRKFNITPQRALGVVISLVVLGFFVYLWVEYRQFVGAPPLQVESPKEGHTVEIPSVVVSGKTESEVKVKVNEQEIGVDKDGNFREEIKLSSSTNKIEITATSRFGQSSKVERTVFVKK
ncbi:helix-turn-helix domain-containing protein [Candidatus Daviesbacteria bacterium]|nr:helix-turn-helix domain-containing protein [Candidatus Daviesbacteria bacterium]